MKIHENVYHLTKAKNTSLCVDFIGNQQTELSQGISWAYSQNNGPSKVHKSLNVWLYTRVIKAMDDIKRVDQPALTE